MESADARKDSLVTDRVSSPEGQAGTAISSSSPSVENGHARQEDNSISVEETELENETAIAAEEAIEQTSDATVVSEPVDTLDMLDSKKLVVHTTVCNGTMSNTITVSSNGMMSSVNSASTIHKRTGIKQMRSTPYTKTTPSNSTPSSSSYPVMGYQLLPIVPQQLFFPVSYLPHQTSQISKNQRYQLDEPILSSTNLYIRGLPETCTDEDLTNMCIQYGKIVSTKAILDKKTTLCKGYGFVDFQNPQDAQKALDTLQSQGVMVQFARLQEQDPTNLYLSNLPKTFSEKHLEQILSPFGTIISTRILREANGYSRGVGFVRLDSQEHCEKAIDGLNGTLLPGATEPLNIKFADSGSYRKKTSTGQYKDATFPDVFSSGPGLWKDYVVPPDYVYDVPPVLPHNGHNSSRLLHQQILSGTSPYIHPSSQVSGYQVQGGGTTTGTWPNSYYITPANSALGNSHATNGGDNLHTLASHMSQLQLSSASTNGGTTYTAQPHNHQYTLPSGSAAGTHSAPPIPTHTAHYTQQPPGWTISPTTHYIPQHS